MLNALLVGLEHFHCSFATRIIRTVEAPKSTYLVLVADVVRDTTEAVDVEGAIILGILAHHVANFEESLFI